MNMVIDDINDSEAIVKEYFDSGFVHIKTDPKNINPDVLKQIGKYFGKLLVTGKHHIPGDRYIQLISEDALFGSGDVPWHNDFSYSPGDYHGSLLAFVEADTPTYTEFTDCNQAYIQLSEEDKKYIEDVECTFGIPGKYDGLISDTQVKVIQKVVMKRPMAMTHPVTNQKSIYFSPETLMETNKPIDKERYVKHCESIAFKHHWESGSMILWDNRRMLHRRKPFTGHRKLLRVNFQYEFKDHGYTVH
tara:strand:- start:283 stop:1023 length:741 start_codon:yes stop_codon:yes gene_type:complete